tara:strand:- start:1423 stop:1983 length:561 start_codon:yes stop_codon:yes gene_type:complete
MATLKTQTTAFVNALHKAKQAEAKPLAVLLESAAVVNTVEDLKEFGNAVQAGLIAKGWTEGSANAQRSKAKRIVGTMSATDKKMVEAHGIGNREQGSKLVHQLAAEATNISDLYTALAPNKLEEPTDADSADAEPTTDEPLDVNAKTPSELLDIYEENGKLHGWTRTELAQAALERYMVELEKQVA